MKKFIPDPPPDLSTPSRLAAFVAERIGGMRILDRQQFYDELTRLIPPSLLP